MRQSVVNRMSRTFSRVINSPMGQVCTLEWLISDTGVYNKYTKEYEGGVRSVDKQENVPCLVVEIDAQRLVYGNYGNAQAGDVLIAFSRDVPVDQLTNLRVTYNSVTYKPVSDSTCPTDVYSVPIGKSQVCRMLHCRLEGRQ